MKLRKSGMDLKFTVTIKKTILIKLWLFEPNNETI